MKNKLITTVFYPIVIGEKYNPVVILRYLQELKNSGEEYVSFKGNNNLICNIKLNSVLKNFNEVTNPFWNYLKWIGWKYITNSNDKFRIDYKLK